MGLSDSLHGVPILGSHNQFNLSHHKFKEYRTIMQRLTVYCTADFVSQCILHSCPQGMAANGSTAEVIGRSVEACRVQVS